MSQSCPISTVSIDSHLVRVISLQVAFVTLLLMITQFKLLALFLVLDFTLRALRLSHLSLFAQLGKSMLTHFSVKAKYCDESPKRFALYLGLIISSFITILFFSGMTKVAIFVSLILLICALLEALFDFCIGCKIYYVIHIVKFKLGK